MWNVVKVAVLGLALGLAFTGCDSAEIKTSELAGNPEEWWNNPGLIQDYLATVGVAPLLNKRAVGPTRTYAETDGRAKMAATLKAKINQLVETWSKDVGDLVREGSFSSYVNNEAITRQFVDATIQGAVPYKYKEDGNNTYVLMVLKNPEQWVANLSDTVRDSMLQDETLWKTEVMKNDFRNKMDSLRNEQVDQYRKQSQDFQEKFGNK
jgi:hypothetical protein